MTEDNQYSPIANPVWLVQVVSGACSLTGAQAQMAPSGELVFYAGGKRVTSLWANDGRPVLGGRSIPTWIASCVVGEIVSDIRALPSIEKTNNQ